MVGSETFYLMDDFDILQARIESRQQVNGTAYERYSVQE